MALYNVGPLALLLLFVAPVLLAPWSKRVDRVVSRIGLALFGQYVHDEGRKRSTRKRLLRRAYMSTTYRIYGAKTLLYATVAAVAGSILGLYAFWGLLVLLAIPPEAVRAALPGSLHALAGLVGAPRLTANELLSLLAVACLTLGVAAGIAAYWLRWWYPSYRAASRRRQIEANLPQTVAFMYALSRSGMEFPEVLRVLSRNRHVYGAPAEEVGVAVRSVELFGTDVITAIRTMGRRTPSTQFGEFAENLASVLQSGQSLSAFLEQQHEQFREEAESQQEQLLNQLAAIAEGYVTVLVAGPLFLITILVVIGLAVTDTLPLLRLLVYLVLPVANVGFILYLSSVMGESGHPGRIDDVSRHAEQLQDVRRVGDPSARTDGGGADGHRSVSARDASDRVAANRERLALYRCFQQLRERLGDPFATVVERPTALLMVTVPFALAITAVRLYWASSLGVPFSVLVDDYLIQAALFVVGTFAIVHQIHRRRIEMIEAAVPDFLERMASVNEAGMTIVESVDRVRGSDLGALDNELDRVWGDIQWGADVESALRRFEHRVRTRTVSRVVTLLTNAMNASGDLARVLRIAANQAKADRRLERVRRQEMFTYVVVVYVAFGVFLIIIAALDTVLIPSLPDDSTLPQTTGAAGQFAPTQSFEGIGTINESAYTLIFFHATVIQGVFSGLIAGQMSSGDVEDGAKHAAVLLSFSYLGFLLL